MKIDEPEKEMIMMMVVMMMGKNKASNKQAFTRESFSE